MLGLFVTTLVAHEKGMGTNLKHLNADERIEGLLKFSRNLPIIEKVYANTALKTHSLDALFCQRLLFD